MKLFSSLSFSLLNNIVISVLMNGLTAITVFFGSCSLFLLLSIVHFWYGISRYSSLWNSVVPTGLKGSTLDRNFSEIREICSYHHNGNDRINSPVLAFTITLPFTILFHMMAFLVTTAYFLLGLSRYGGTERKIPDPVITSIFLSNAVISSLWLLGGKAGIVFATLTIFFNQKAYNSLLFKRNFKDFCLSLVWGNLLVVNKKLTTGGTEIALSEKSIGCDIEEGMQQITTEPSAGEDKQYSPITLPSPIQFLPPLLGASSSSSANSLADQKAATSTNFSAATQQNFLTMMNDNAFCLHNNDERIKENQNNASPPETSLNETISKQPREALRQLVVTVKPAPQIVENNAVFEAVFETVLEKDAEDIEENKVDVEIKTEEVERSTKSSKKNFFGLSRRMFSSPRNKHNQSKKHGYETQGDDELSVEFLNPSDIHLGMENHPGTMEWRNIISESIQRFKIKSYTLRKHNWVMNQMHRKTFFTKEYGERRRKLKRKEIKERCRAFHDKQLHLNSQISVILDDLKDLKNNHNNSKSKSNSDHTRNSLAYNTPSQIKEKPGNFANMPSTREEYRTQKVNYTMSDSNYQAPKYDAASTAKESLVESFKDSTISTLTQSFNYPDDARSRPGEINIPSEKTIDSSSTFREAINGLLQCSPWIDNMNMLKEVGSKEMNDDSKTPRKNDTQTNDKQQQYEFSENVRIVVEDGNQKDSSNAPRKAYWRNFVEEESKAETSNELIPAVDLPPWKRRKSYPWRSDLQKKKTEKARENRSQSKGFALKQTKRVIAIWKKKQRKTEPYQKVGLEEKKKDSPRNLKTKENEKTDTFCGDDDRHEVVGNHRAPGENQRDIQLEPYDEIVDNPHFRAHLRSSQNDDPEMTTATKHTMYTKTTSADFGRECGAFVGIVGVCSHHPVTEQREDEGFLSDRVII